MNHPVPTGFGALPMLDLRNPNFTVEGNRLLAELRAKGSLCRVEPLGSLGFLRWADCDAILRDFRTFSAAFEHSKPVNAYLLCRKGQAEQNQICRLFPICISESKSNRTAAKYCLCVDLLP
jgi:hypothetical protein